MSLATDQIAIEGGVLSPEAIRSVIAQMAGMPQPLQRLAGYVSLADITKHYDEKVMKPLMDAHMKNLIKDGQSFMVIGDGGPRVMEFSQVQDPTKWEVA